MQSVGFHIRLAAVASFESSLPINRARTRFKYTEAHSNDISALNMSKSIVLFTFGFSLAALVTSQTSSMGLSETCGYIDGGRVVITACKPSTNGRTCPDSDLAIECTSRACGFLFIYGHDNAYAGCCGEERCAIATTCIESGTALNSNTVQW